MEHEGFSTLFARLVAVRMSLSSILTPLMKTLDKTSERLHCEQSMLLNGAAKMLAYGDVFLGPQKTASNAVACAAVDLTGADAAADQTSCGAASGGAGACAYVPDDAATTGTDEEACAATTALQNVALCVAVSLAGADAAADEASCLAAGFCTYTPDDAGTAGTDEEACAATVAMAISATKATLAAGVDFELSASSSLVSAGTAMDLKVTAAGVATTVLQLTGTGVQASQPLKIMDGSSLQSGGGTMGNVVDMAITAGTGTGTNAKGGGVTISAGDPVTLGDGSVSYGQCDPQQSLSAGVAYNPGLLIDLSLADFNTLTEQCSPGDVVLQSDASAGGTLTQIKISETVDLEDTPPVSNGAIEFRVDGTKIIEFTALKVETFAPMTVNGFDLQVSDRRIKRNITDADPTDSLATIRKLRLREYKLHDTYAASSQNQNEVPMKGFIAQEVAEILPHAVRQFDRTFEAKGMDDLEVKAMNHVQYDYIYLESIGALKSLIEQFDELQEGRVAEKAAMKEMKAELREMKAAMQQQKAAAEEQKAAIKVEFMEEIMAAMGR